MIETKARASLFVRYFFNEVLKDEMLFFQGMSTNKKSIHPRERLLIYLFHIGHNPSYDVSAYSHDISKGVIAQSIKLVNNALYDYLVPRYIKFPTPQEAEASAEKFKEQGFPAKLIWGALDGTHVLVRPPINNRDKYHNRHGTTSLNVLLLVDADGIFRWCASHSPGRQHDSAIFHDSKLCKKLQKWSERHLPFKHAVIAADSAFRRNLAYLLTPFLIAETVENQMKKDFNSLFCALRAIIERYIGILKVLSKHVEAWELKET